LAEKILLISRHLKLFALDSFPKKLFCLCILGFLSLKPHAQEIEARAYSNAPIGINFVTGGIAQVKSGSYKLTTEAIGLTHIVDVAGQSGRISLVLPYAELSGSGTVSGQAINASAEGLSDPMIKASFIYLVHLLFRQVSSRTINKISLLVQVSLLPFHGVSTTAIK